MYSGKLPYQFWGNPLDIEPKGPWGWFASILGSATAAVLGKELIKRWRAPKEKEIDAEEHFLTAVMARVSELEGKLDQFQEDHREIMLRVHAEYEKRIINYRAELHECRRECQRYMAEAIRRGYDPDAPTVVRP